MGVSGPARESGLARTELSGPWEFVVGPEDLATARIAVGTSIEVPSVWEADGWENLDGPAWYRSYFDLDVPEAFWTLHFGGVMDVAEVYLNGNRLGEHHGAFTPFEFDCLGDLRARDNELLVRVTDIPRGTPEHGRMAHGKQGWMNDVFPSPPSLYLDYGGIWQPVWLERHGPARVVRLWSNCHPHGFTVYADLRAVRSTVARVELRVFGRSYGKEVAVDGRTTMCFELGEVAGEGMWWPEDPVLHQVALSVFVGEELCDARSERIGLRVIELSEGSFCLNGRSFSMRSALVQGFSRRSLYGGMTRIEAEYEVRKALSLGLNTLRLHIKAFDPTYLDVCDEMGMLVHCDIPVAEPVAHGELGEGGLLSDACVLAAAEQVRRDVNHPSIVLWSAMNELGAEDLAVRETPGYEAFARRLYDVVRREDGTRPVIENDWIEPGAGRVFCSPILTAHWYGRLSAGYLVDLRERVAAGASSGRPLFMSEFGDWGLPALDGMGQTETFWSYETKLSALIEGSRWEGTVADFVLGTQRYQGLADRLQVELFRGQAGLVGWCLTELTDVPQEFNGLLDIDRVEKAPACAEVRSAAQALLPFLERPHWSCFAGGDLHASLVLDNDGPSLSDAGVTATLGKSSWSAVVDLPAHDRLRPGQVNLPVGDAAGQLRLGLEVRHQGRVVATNYYPVHIVRRRHVGKGFVTDSPGLADLIVNLGGGAVARAEASPHAHVLVVEEDSVRPYEDQVLQWLVGGGSVVVLAQVELPQELADALEMELTSLATEWGSTPFVFTNGTAELVPSLPARRVLATELLSATPEHVYTRFGERRDSTVCAVGILKVPPAPIDGLVVGRRAVLGGRLTVCQLPLAAGVVAGDALCTGLLVDLLSCAGDTAL